MTSYIIAGSSDRKELTICENIARQIKSVYTNIEFNMILKHPSEWDDAIKIICKHYGLKKASNPIIFAKTGRPVGGVDEFIKLAEEKFGIDVKNLTNTVDPSVNQKIAQNDYDERHRERTLVEQIEDKYKSLLANHKLTKLQGFYEPKIDKGIEYFVKETEAMAPKIDVPLKVKYDYQKERPFEDFMADFCEGMMKITSVEEGDRSANEGARPPSGAKLEKQGTSDVSPTGKLAASVVAPTEEVKAALEKVPEDRAQEDKAQEEEKLQENQPAINLEEQQQQQVQDSRVESNPMPNSADQSPKIAETSMYGAALAASEVSKLKTGQPFTLTVLNDYIVKDLGDDYYLSFHPQPLYEGQCIILNNAYNKYKESFGVPADAYDESEENVALFDYSLHGRKESGKDYTEKSAKNRLKNEGVKSFLNKLESSVYEPLSALDWTYIYKVAKETDSISFMQLLPHGKKNYRHLSNGIVSIMLRQFLLKEHQNLGLHHPNADQETQLPFEKIIEKGIAVYAEKQPEDYITLGDLPFNHKLTLINDSIDGHQFKRTYFEMMQKLNEIYGEEIEEYGINILVSTKWLMVIPITAPFTSQKDTDIYLDSLIYLGYIVLPNMEKILPPHEKVNEEKKIPGKILSNFLPK